jgi:pentatricopeptide repeat protein
MQQLIHLSETDASQSKQVDLGLYDKLFTLVRQTYSYSKKKASKNGEHTSIKLKQHYVTIYNTMQKHGVQPTTFMYNNLILAFSSHQVKRALFFFEDMAKNGVKPNVYTLNIMVNALCKQKDVASARQVFETMQEMGVCADVTSYGTMMNVFAEKGELSNTVRLFKSMTKANVQPNLLIFNTMIKACIKAKKVEQIPTFLEEMKRFQVAPDIVTWNTAMIAYLKRRKWSRAVEAYEQMKKSNIAPDSATYNTFVEYLNEEPTQLSPIVLEMQQQGLKPCVVSFNSLIHDAISKKNLPLAKKLYAKLRTSMLEPDLVTYTTMIQASVASGDDYGALSLYKEMLEKDIEPDSTTYSSLITGYANMGDIQPALSILDKLLSNSMDPQKAAGESLIKACYKQANFDTANKVWGMYKKHNVEFDPLTEAYYASLCMSNGYLDEGQALISKLLKRNPIPFPVVAALIKCLVQNPTFVPIASKLYSEQRAQGFELYNDVASALLSGAKFTRDVSLGMTVWNDILLSSQNADRQPSNSVVLDVLMLCRDAHQVQNARTVMQYLKSSQYSTFTEPIFITYLQCLLQANAFKEAVSTIMSMEHYDVDPSEFAVRIVVQRVKEAQKAELLDPLYSYISEYYPYAMKALY